MKKALLLLLFAAICLSNFAQSWVEVGVDTQYGSWFKPADVIMIDDSIGYLVGISYGSTSSIYQNRHCLLKTMNGGVTWDSVAILNTLTFTGNFYQFRYFNNQLHALAPFKRSYPSPTSQYHLDYGLYEDFVSDSEYDTLLSGSRLAVNKYATRICPINDSIVVLAMEQYMGNGGTGLPYGYSYIAHFNKNTKHFETAVIDLPDTMEFIHEIHFTDGLHGYVVGGSDRRRQNGYLFSTTDGGLTWETMKQAQVGMYYCVNFFDKNRGIMGGDEDLYFTTNAGFDWYPAIGIPSRFIVQDIATITSTAYVIGSFHYRVGAQDKYKAQIYKSMDYGKEWCLMYESEMDLTYSTMNRQMHISFSSETHGVAAFGYNRLIRTENGGGLTECVTGIGETENSALISIYPNPNQGSFTMNFPTKEVHTITIIDLNGKVISNLQNQGGVIQIMGLENGIYVLSFATKGYVYYKKLIVAQ